MAVTSPAATLGDMQRRALLFAAVLLGLACRADAPAPEPLARNVDLEALETAVDWPNAEVAPIMMLATQYFASRRDEDAYASFSRLAAAHPDRGMFLALAGLFQARMAEQITLTERIGWVREAIDKLDAAVELDTEMSRLLRGATLAALPERFDTAERAVADLESVLQPDSFLVELPLTLRDGIRRTAWHSLGLAYMTLGRETDADEALARSGVAVDDPNAPLLATPWSVNARDGFRFASPELLDVATGVWVARGFDFADIAFVLTNDGVVVIDTGTTVGTGRAALMAFREQVSRAPIEAVILTHGHWDHVGGLAAFLDDDPQVIAQIGIHDELERIAGTGVAYTWFFGAEFEREVLHVDADILVAEPERRTIGGTEVELIPVHGGETEDALLVHLPHTGIVFVGDAFMPYVGAPFIAEGSPEGLLETIDTLQELAPARLVHGHVPLTDFYTVDVLDPLEQSLHELYDRTRTSIRDGRPLAAMIQDNVLPDILRDHPSAVVPYLVLRDQFVQRVQRDHTGYWQPESQGLAIDSRTEWATALDLLGGEDPTSFISAGEVLIARGDHTLAFELLDLGTRVHPDDVVLFGLRQRALDGLRERYQLLNPFKYIVYSELGGTPTSPVGGEP